MANVYKCQYSFAIYAFALWHYHQHGWQQDRLTYVDLDPKKFGDQNLLGDDACLAD